MDEDGYMELIVISGSASAALVVLELIAYMRTSMEWMLRRRHLTV